jgi:2-polyprenyl-3-methyl-5-hydroxy-6-metoxy-1,4-benzoquinol methylase
MCKQGRFLSNTARPANVYRKRTISAKEQPMSDPHLPADPKALNQQVQAIWDQIAPFWDARMGEGNQFHKLLVEPSAERLLALQPGEQVLELACGTGLFSRRMAELGAAVTATDFSPTMLKIAKTRAGALSDQIAFRLVDVTEEAQLHALGKQCFDAAVCNMALMDMAEIAPLAQAMPHLLKAGGRFVFTTMHPCFNSALPALVHEEEDREGELLDIYSIKIAHYRRARQMRGLGMIGQPVVQYYFHRSLTDLLAPWFGAGFALDGLEEPVFDDRASSPRPLSWANYRDIPPVLAARLRLVR